MNSCKSVLSFADISDCHTVHPFLYNNFLQFSISFKACQGLCVILETIFYIFSPRFSYGFHKAGVYFSHSQKPKTKFHVHKNIRFFPHGSGLTIGGPEKITCCSDFDCFSAVPVCTDPICICCGVRVLLKIGAAPTDSLRDSPSRSYPYRSPIIPKIPCP